MKNKVMDIYRPKNETLNDAFDRLVVKIHHQNRMHGHKTFVLTGCEPMVGTTTIAINVAISLAVSGLKTILIDGDLRKDGKYKRLNDSVEMGLSDVLAGNLDLASAICATNYVTLDYLPSGIKDENPVGLLYSPNLNEVISSLSEYYDYVIFDLPSANAAIDSNIFASKCDAVVLVAKQYSTNVMQIRNAKQELEKIAANLVGIVFNNVDSVEYRRYMKNYDYFNKNKFLVTKKKKKGKKGEKGEVSSKKKSLKKGAETSAFDLEYEKYVDEDEQASTYLKNESEPDIYDEDVATAILEEETSEDSIVEENVSEATDENMLEDELGDGISDDKEMSDTERPAVIDMSDVIDEVRDDVIEAELDSVVGEDSRDNEFQEITDEEFSTESDYADEVYRKNYAMKVEGREDMYHGVYNQTEYNNGYISSGNMDNADMGYGNVYMNNGVYANDYAVETSEIASRIGDEYGHSAFTSEVGYRENVNDGNMNYEYHVEQYNTYSDNGYGQEQQLYGQDNYETESNVEEAQEEIIKESKDNKEIEVSEQEEETEEVQVQEERIEEPKDIKETEVSEGKKEIEEVQVQEERIEEPEDIKETEVSEQEEETEEVQVQEERIEEPKDIKETEVSEQEEETEKVQVQEERTEEPKDIKETEVSEQEEEIEEVQLQEERIEEPEDIKETEVSEGEKEIEGVQEEAVNDAEEIDFIEEDIEDEPEGTTSYRKQLERLKERFNYKSERDSSISDRKETTDEKNMNYSDMDKGLDDVVYEIEQAVSKQNDRECEEINEEI